MLLIIFTRETALGPVWHQFFTIHNNFFHKLETGKKREIKVGISESRKSVTPALSREFRSCISHKGE
jgi:hypothetical protein